MKAYELLSDASKWTQDVLARDAEGNVVAPDSDDAVCWCLMGALYHCYRKPPRLREDKTLYREVLVRVAEVITDETGGRFDMASWNDLPGRSFDEVRKMLKKADV